MMTRDGVKCIVLTGLSIHEHDRPAASDTLGND